MPAPAAALIRPPVPAEQPREIYCPSYSAAAVFIWQGCCNNSSSGERNWIQTDTVEVQVTILGIPAGATVESGIRAWTDLPEGPHWEANGAARQGGTSTGRDAIQGKKKQSINFKGREKDFVRPRPRPPGASKSSCVSSRAGGSGKRGDVGALDSLAGGITPPLPSPPRIGMNVARNFAGPLQPADRHGQGVHFVVVEFLQLDLKSIFMLDFHSALF